MTIRQPGDPGYDPEVARHAGRMYGRRKALVVNVDDPDQRGRVKLFIPGLMSGPSTDTAQQTDWADPVMLQGEKKDDPEVGAFVVPPVGSYVWVEFQQGRFDFPVYHGGFWRRSKLIPALARGEDDGNTLGDQSVAGVTLPGSGAGNSTYPSNRVYKSSTGITIELDDTPGNNRVRIRHPRGSFIEMKQNATITMRAVIPGGEVIGVDGDVAILADRNLLLAAKSTSKLVATTEVKLGADSASDSLVKGDTRYGDERTLITAWAAFITALKAATSVAQVAAAANTFDVPLTAWKTSVDGSTHLSSKVKTE